MSYWESIETAPKDGEPFPAIWLGRFRAAFWNTEQQNWQEYPDGDFDTGGELTHWFRLPPVPK
jgi:hypothetical protein